MFPLNGVFFIGMRKKIGLKAYLILHCSFFLTDISRFVLNYFFGVGSKRLRLTKRISNAFLGDCNSSARQYHPTPSPLPSLEVLLQTVVFNAQSSGKFMSLSNLVLNYYSFMSFSVLMQQFSIISFNVKVRTSGKDTSHGVEEK